MGPLLNGAGELLPNDTEKASLVSSFFDSVFFCKIVLQQFHISESIRKVWNKKDLYLVEKDQVREYLNKLDTELHRRDIVRYTHE